MSHHLVGTAEIAEMLGVTRQRVGQIAATDPDFPDPEVVLASGRVWRRDEVEAWIEHHPRRGPGRPRGGRTRSS